MEKLKLEGKALTREQMKGVVGGMVAADDCTCIAPNNAWLCISNGCALHSDGTCTSPILY